MKIFRSVFFFLLGVLPAGLCFTQPTKPSKGTDWAGALNAFDTTFGLTISAPLEFVGRIYPHLPPSGVSASDFQEVSRGVERFGIGLTILASAAEVYNGYQTGGIGESIYQGFWELPTLATSAVPVFGGVVDYAFDELQAWVNDRATAISAQYYADQAQRPGVVDITADLTPPPPPAPPNPAPPDKVADGISGGENPGPTIGSGNSEATPTAAPGPTPQDRFAGGIYGGQNTGPVMGLGSGEDGPHKEKEEDPEDDLDKIIELLVELDMAELKANIENLKRLGIDTSGGEQELGAAREVVSDHYRVLLKAGGDLQRRSAIDRLRAAGKWPEK